MTALYLERFMNYGITPEELRSGKPIIGIAQTGSDISPCNRIHLDLVTRIRDGIRDAGGIPMEFPVHPIFENCRRPTAALDRNLSYLGLVETLHGYPIDAVVLTTGCDKTTPAGIMAATTVNIPAIVLSGGPMLDGWHDGELVGSGTVIWRSRRKLAAGEINEDEFIQRAADSAPLGRPLQHHGHGLDHERRGRGPGPVADRLRGDPRPLPRARPDGLPHRPADRRPGL
jgi:dihydroxyacid dehydratase/phosphogluconate dehydratase